MFILGIVGATPAQVFPKENSKLNYRLVGFSFPSVAGVKGYTIDLVTGTYTTEAAFTKNIIYQFQTDSNRLIAEVPAFGKDYTWRIRYTKNGAILKSVFHHFSSVISSGVDTNITRLKILKKAEKHSDAYIFIDGAGAMYDMAGNPVWYIPETKELSLKKCKIWDLKLTPRGTFTFISDQNIYEINYDGDVLWKGSNNGRISGDSIEYYHHEFTMLQNWHYMVLGSEFLPGTLLAYPDTGNTAKLAKMPKTMFGTLIEYDQRGNVVWSWKSAQFFKDIDPKYLASDIVSLGVPKNIIDVHENAFYFDEKEKIVYLSFKNISTVLKIKYPEGTVLNTYGKLANELTPANAPSQEFCGQHSCKTNSNGDLYLYNNNACHGNAVPQIQMYEQAKNPNNTLKKIWEYTCNFDDVINEKRTEGQLPAEIVSPEQLSSLNIFSKGGNVIELPDHNIFASICGAYGKVFILTPDKKTLWSALPQMRNIYQNKWEDNLNYKANIILDPKTLEQAIFEAEKK